MDGILGAQRPPLTAFLGSIPYEVWLPVVTLVLGYVFSLTTEAFRDRRQSGRDRDAREQERAERKTQFQREWLLELQEVLIQIVRTYGEEHHQDLMTSRKAGQWQQHLLGGDISDRNFAATQRKTLPVSRIDDDEVRELSAR